MKFIFIKLMNECPECRSHAIRNSERHGFVEKFWLRLFFVWPYRCDQCDTRFWGFHSAYETVQVPAHAVSAPRRAPATGLRFPA
jgi:hypothetical protein